MNNYMYLESTKLPRVKTWGGAVSSKLINDLIEFDKSPLEAYNDNN